MQNIIVYILVAAALTYIGIRTYRSLMHKGHSGCEHCAPDTKKTIPGK